MKKQEVIREVQFELKRFDAVTKRLIETTYDRLERNYGDYDDLIQAIADDVYNR